MRYIDIHSRHFMLHFLLLQLHKLAWSFCTWLPEIEFLHSLYSTGPVSLFVTSESFMNLFTQALNFNMVKYEKCFVLSWRQPSYFCFVLLFSFFLFLPMQTLQHHVVKSKVLITLCHQQEDDLFSVPCSTVSYMCTLQD